MQTTQFKTGDKIQILCHNYQTKKDEWLNGTFNHTVTALDRDYRVNCTLETGQEIREAAPECIKPLYGKLNTVKVLFADSSNNYTTNVSSQTTEITAMQYFAGKCFNMGVFPVENMQQCIGIEFTDNNL